MHGEKIKVKKVLIIPFGAATLRKEKNELDKPYILRKLNRNNVLKMGTKSDPQKNVSMSIHS